MNELGIAIDLSHVGQRTMLGAIEASSQPVLVTHANARALANLERNKTDDIIRAVVGSGGVIGASIYGPMCWDQNPARKPTIDDYIRHLEHIVNIAAPITLPSAPTSQRGPASSAWRSSGGTGVVGKASTGSTNFWGGHSCSLSRRLQQALGSAQGDRGPGAAWLEGGTNSWLPRCNLKRVLDRIWSGGRT